MTRMSHASRGAGLQAGICAQSAPFHLGRECSRRTVKPVSQQLEAPPKKQVATRDAYGEALLQLGASHTDVVVLDADLSGSTRTKAFSKAYPERFFNMGVAEANMTGTAAGLAASGKTVFISSFAMFAAGKAWEQVRQTVCVPRMNVKICATHAGLTVGEDGKSHQMLEDLALMRVLPNMTVIVPADGTEACRVIETAADFDGPMYIRLSRAKTPLVFGNDYKYEIGKGNVVRNGKDLAIVACGVEVAAAMGAAEILAKEGVDCRVINMATIKPIDKELIEKAARECGAILTAEEHQVTGGLGGAVAEFLASCCPVPIEIVGVADSFGESGTADQLLEKYGLDAEGLATRARSLMSRKNNNA
ncbi:MAG: transketolase [Planctomycetota bacterium]|jgi:transketolase